MNTNLIKKNKKYLLTFSGGPDSVYGLIHILNFYKTSFKYTEEEIKKYLGIVYINYHDSDFVDKEEDIVNYYVKKFNLTFYKDDEYEIAKSKNNFENEARVYRYALFSKLAKENNYDGVIVNEHLNDLIETYLIQLKRKNYVSYYSLKDENYINDTLILRPFLDVTKKQIISYLNENNLPYYDDITNLKDRVRNNIRKEFDDNQIEKYLKEIKSKNEILNKINLAIDNSFIDKEHNIFELISLDDFKKVLPNISNIDEIYLEYTKRLIYSSIKNKLDISSSSLFEELPKLTNLFYYQIKGNKNGIYDIDSILYLLIHNSKYQVLLKDEIDYVFRYSFSLKDDLNNYEIDNEFVRFDYSDKLFDYLNLKPQDIYLTNINTLVNDKKDLSIIKMNSKLKGKTLKEFIYKNNIPNCIINLVPILLDNNKDVIYVFMNDKTFNSNVYDFKYLGLFKNLIK